MRVRGAQARDQAPSLNSGSSVSDCLPLILGDVMSSYVRVVDSHEHSILALAKYVLICTNITTGGLYRNMLIGV